MTFYFGDMLYLAIFAGSVTILSIWFRRIQNGRKHKQLSKKQRIESRNNKGRE